LSNLASAICVRTEEASIVAELQAGSEEAFAWLIAQYSQPIYSLVYRLLDNPSDAADTTQEVFIKVFRGIRSFNSNSSLKTWIYRIALHGRTTSAAGGLLVDDSKSPLENVYDEELRARVERELRSVAEPYRTAVILRDIEELSYEQIAEVMEVSLGTVKSRLMRGRDALRKRLERHLPAFGVNVPAVRHKKHRKDGALNGKEVEVMP
jgi:RNA polymerase sigma-70 factor (ECF subfamily)